MGLVLLAAPVSSATAQFAPWSVGIFGGGQFLTGDLGDFFNTGWVAGANVDYRFSEGRSPVSIRLDISYGSSSAKDLGTGSSSSIDAKANSIYGFAYALLHPNIGQAEDRATVDLYAGGGGGFVNSKCSGSDCGDTSGQTDGALVGVVGGAAPIGSVYLFFEGRWVLVFAEDQSESRFPVVAGVRIPFGG